MNVRWAVIGAVALVCLALGGSGVGPQQAPPDPTDWWNIPYPERFAADLDHPPGVIRVERNRFVDEQGATIVLREVNISDPDRLARRGHWDRPLFAVIADWAFTPTRQGAFFRAVLQRHRSETGVDPPAAVGSEPVPRE